MKTLLKISLLTIVLVNPIGDAIRDNGNKRLQKMFELLRELATWLLIYAVTGNLTLAICGGLSHLFYRVALHNLAYNLTRKLPWYFTGSTSKSDEIEAKMDKWNVLAARIVSFLFACLLLWLALKN